MKSVTYLYGFYHFGLTLCMLQIGLLEAGRCGQSCDDDKWMYCQEQPDIKCRPCTICGNITYVQYIASRRSECMRKHPVSQDSQDTNRHDTTIHCEGGTVPSCPLPLDDHIASFTCDKKWFGKALVGAKCTTTCEEDYLLVVEGDYKTVECIFTESGVPSWDKPLPKCANSRPIVKTSPEAIEPVTKVDETEYSPVTSSLFAIVIAFSIVLLLLMAAVVFLIFKTIRRDHHLLHVFQKHILMLVPCRKTNAGYERAGANDTPTTVSDVGEQSVTKKIAYEEKNHVEKPNDAIPVVNSMDEANYVVVDVDTPHHVQPPSGTPTQDHSLLNQHPLTSLPDGQRMIEDHIIGEFAQHIQRVVPKVVFNDDEDLKKSNVQDRCGTLLLEFVNNQKAMFWLSVLIDPTECLKYIGDLGTIQHGDMDMIIKQRGASSETYLVQEMLKLVAGRTTHLCVYDLVVHLLERQPSVIHIVSAIYHFHDDCTKCVTLYKSRGIEMDQMGPFTSKHATPDWIITDTPCSTTLKVFLNQTTHELWNLISKELDADNLTKTCLSEIVGLTDAMIEWLKFHRSEQRPLITEGLKILWTRLNKEDYPVRGLVFWLNNRSKRNLLDNVMMFHNNCEGCKSLVDPLR